MSLLWTVVTIITIAGYFTVVFFLHSSDEILRGGYGVNVYVKVIATMFSSTVYLAVPFAAFIFFVSAFRDTRIKNQVRLKHVIIFCLIIAPLVFWWISFRNPDNQRRLYSLLFDIRQQTPVEQFGQMDSLFDGRTTLTFSGLEVEMEEHLEEANIVRGEMIVRLQEKASIASLELLIQEPEAREIGLSMTDFDYHKSIARDSGATKEALLNILRASSHLERYHYREYFALRHEQRKMITYPLFTALMIVFGFFVSQWTVNVHFSILLLVGLVAFFPGVTILSNYCAIFYRRGLLSSWPSLLILPVIVTLTILILHFTRKRKYSDFRVDFEFSKSEDREESD